jgi:CyaY protein
MTEREFHDLCERTLRAVEDALDACECDVETSRSGNVLEIEFDDGSKIIVSGNLPVRELWVAARAGGFHFRFQDGRWIDTRAGDEFFGCLSRLVSQQGGAPVVLRGMTG